MRYVRSLQAVALCLAPLLTACHHPRPTYTTVIVPESASGTTVICQDGTKPPCKDSSGKVLVCRDGSQPPCK